MAQTFGDWEAICVDDGSTDGSGAILDEYAAKDNRFKVIHQPNAGVSAARNAALDVAKGEWIGFLDADDVWAFDWLEGVALNAEKDVDWVRINLLNSGMFDNHKGAIRTFFSERPVGEISKSVIVDGWHQISRCAYPWINFYCKGLLEIARFPVGIRFREDAIFGFEMALRAKGLKIVSGNGYFRRERPDSAMCSCRRREDTINLLTCYSELWSRLVMTNPIVNEDFVRAKIVEASTFWVHKDVREWFTYCLDMTRGDVQRVNALVRGLLDCGAVSRESLGTRFDRIRWKLYLATGWGRVLRINRLNLIGRQMSLEKASRD